MSRRSTSRKIMTILLVSVGLMLACGAGGTPSISAPAVAATQAALQLQGTALVLQLTQAAMNVPPQVQPANSPAAATVTPRVVLNLNAIEIMYGQKLSNYPRKSQVTIYGFKGTQDDTVTILLASSNARPPTDAKCLGVTASTTFTFKTPNREIPATVEATHLSAIRDYKLPATAAYYVTVTCIGGGCNGYCFEADISLDKK